MSMRRCTVRRRPVLAYVVCSLLSHSRRLFLVWRLVGVCFCLCLLTARSHTHAFLVLGVCARRARGHVALMYGYNNALLDLHPHTHGAHAFVRGALSIGTWWRCPATTVLVSLLGGR